MLKASKSVFSGGPPARRHERKLVLLIAVCWTLFDLGFFYWRKTLGILPEKYYDPASSLLREVLVREMVVFFISLLIGYFLITVLKNYLRNASLWVNLTVKTLLLLLAAFVMTFFLYIAYQCLVAGKSPGVALEKFSYNLLHERMLLEKMPEWIILFLGTQLALEVSQKYSRGVFFNIMIGRYLQPKEERRIILFLDLKDSTPIAEKLGHKKYFSFIRDFIFHISSGFLDYDGRIYQYVGDEIVVWWPESKKNAKKAVASLIMARKELHKKFDRFKRKYDVLPEYKAGIHTGMVTVGQVGIVKKDLVMSGDVINTAARIRSACTEMNQKYIVSKEVADLLELQEWQTQSLGPIDLKGKNQSVELFALKI